jgi:hypothetical protein
MPQLAFLVLTVANTLATVNALNIATTDEIVDVYYSKIWFGESWAAVGCFFVVVWIQSIEYGLQKFTPKGGTINSSHKPPEVPWVSVNWNAMGKGLGGVAVGVAEIAS